jgi:hypothetical protein
VVFAMKALTDVVKQQRDKDPLFLLTEEIIPIGREKRH